jgi:hypothetical protein
VVERRDEAGPERAGFEISPVGMIGYTGASVLERAHLVKEKKPARWSRADFCFWGGGAAMRYVAIRKSEGRT